MSNDNTYYQVQDLYYSMNNAVLHVLISRGLQLHLALFNTPFNEIVRNRHIARLLRENKLGYLDKETAFLTAAESGHTAVVKHMLSARRGGYCCRNFDVNMVDVEGRTALSLAVLKGHYKVVKALVGVVDTGRTDHFGKSALDHAVSKGWVVVVKCIVSQDIYAPASASVDSPSTSTSSPSSTTTTTTTTTPTPAPDAKESNALNTVEISSPPLHPGPPSTVTAPLAGPVRTSARLPRWGRWTSLTLFCCRCWRYLQQRRQPLSQLEA
jgi:hypothetical protein